VDITKSIIQQPQIVGYIYSSSKLGFEAPLEAKIRMKITIQVQPLCNQASLCSAPRSFTFISAELSDADSKYNMLLVAVIISVIVEHFLDAGVILGVLLLTGGFPKPSFQGTDVQFRLLVIHDLAAKKTLFLL